MRSTAGSTVSCSPSITSGSVITRVCRGQDAADKHLGRVEKNLPPKGSIRALQVTELRKRLKGKRKTGIG